MTGRSHRPPTSDRARRRAIRALAARLGVPYMVAARLLAAGPPGSDPAGSTARDPAALAPDEHRAWVFAMREQRPFDLRVRDTRLAADLPLGRAAHLVERLPALRRPPIGPLYDGDARQATLAMLYTVVAVETPATLPGGDELSWVAELGEEAAVDIVCAGPDRAARLLLDGDRWRLWTRIEAALDAGESAPDRRVRDAAITLGREFRTTVLRGSMDGARHTLDAVLVAAYDGHTPGARVLIRAGAHRGTTATVVGVEWPRTGPPDAYLVHLDELSVTLTCGLDDIAGVDITGPDRPHRPQPAGL